MVLVWEGSEAALVKEEERTTIMLRSRCPAKEQTFPDDRLTD